MIGGRQETDTKADKSTVIKASVQVSTSFCISNRTEAEVGWLSVIYGIVLELFSNSRDAQLFSGSTSSTRKTAECSRLDVDGETFSLTAPNPMKGKPVHFN